MFSVTSVLRSNATSCLVFGLLFVVWPHSVAYFLGGDEAASAISFRVIGLALILHGVDLLATAAKPEKSRLRLLYFALGDALWVVGSAVLILLGIWITTTPGIVSTVVVAMMVGAFGALQYYHATRLNVHGQNSSEMRS